MNPDIMECPTCKTPMTGGTAEIHGNSIGFLLVGFSWQELFFKAGEAAGEESLLSPNEIRRAYRCPACGLAVLCPESAPTEEAERADASEPSECLACGAVLGTGEIRCPQCGWSYKDPPAKPGKPT